MSLTEWTKCGKDARWHFAISRTDQRYLCGRQIKCEGQRNYLAEAITLSRDNSDLCPKCLLILREHSNTPNFINYPVTLPKPKIEFPNLTTSRKNLIIHLEEFMSYCYGERIQNYRNWQFESEGRGFLYPITFNQRNGTIVALKHNQRYKLKQWIDPENELYDKNFDDKVFLSGHYNLGSNKIAIYRNIEQSLVHFEAVYGLNFEHPLPSNIKKNAQNNKESDCARLRLLKSLNFIVSQNANAFKRFPTKYSLDDDGDDRAFLPQYIPELEAYLRGFWHSGTNKFLVNRNLNNLLIYLESNYGLNIDEPRNVKT